MTTFARFAILLIAVTSAARADSPPVTALRVLPDSLTLRDARDTQRLLVLGKLPDGREIDLSGEATLRAEGDAIAIGEGLSVRPAKVGSASVTVTARGQTASVPVQVSSILTAPVGFVRDAQPVLAKMGCNQGTCHGAAKGKEGFQLSLRGYDPEHDYKTFTEELGGRRIDRVNPDNSLMLLKPSGGAPHEGGRILQKDSEDYAILKQWIAEGARPQSLSARAVGVEVLPGNLHLSMPGESHRILVRATYADGTTRDVTSEAVISSNNTEVVEVTGNSAKGLRRGEAALLVRYEGNYAAREVFVMGDRSQFDSKWVTEAPEYNFVDKHTKTKWLEMKIRPSELCTDAEYARRVALDLTGQPLDAERTKAFLADPTPSREKREKLADELLASDALVEFWTNRWADLLQANAKALGGKSLFMFRAWVRERIDANVPYDQFVRELLLAKGSSYANPAVNYYRALQTPEKTQEKTTEDVTQTFLGIRFNCNHCHDHPFERWTQKQYYDFASYFASLSFKKGQLPDETIVYTNPDGGAQLHPKTKAPVDPMVPYGSTADAKTAPDRRGPMVAWLTSPENPYFAKSYANRVWSYFFGRGIIDPVDDIRAGNPPSNGALLDALTNDFVSSKFDVRRLMRTIVTSRTYQLSVASNDWNKDDLINFSHALPRRLSAEQLVDAVAVATGYRPKFKGLPAGTRAAEAPDAVVEGSDTLALFGRPKRSTACECERTNNISLSHAINLVNGSTIGEACARPDSKIVQIVKAHPDDKAVVNELYIAILNRPATDIEKNVSLGKPDERLGTAQDLAWALMNSPAFLFNR